MTGLAFHFDTSSVNCSLILPRLIYLFHKIVFHKISQQNLNKSAFKSLNLKACGKFLQIVTPQANWAQLDKNLTVRHNDWIWYEMKRVDYGE